MLQRTREASCALVYELYGLTEEEIAIVEGRDHSSGTVAYLSTHHLHALELALLRKGGCANVS